VFSRICPGEELVKVVRAALEDDARIISGVSELPNKAGISARILGTTANDVDRARTAAWNAARLKLVGAPAPNLRKA
jgi:urease accessory protein UreH